MTVDTRDLLQIIVLILLAIVAVYRWVRFFRSRKAGVEHRFTRWESISLMILLAAYVYLTFFVKPV